MPGKREDYASWEEYYMNLASVATTRSKDPSTQVGACIVKDFRVLSLGYNGLTKGMNDDSFYWNSEGEITGDITRIKDPYVLHAERNAVYNYRGSLSDFEGSTLYVTLFPCHECIKTIISVGIKKIVYRMMYSKVNPATKVMLDAAGVIVEQYSKDSEILTKEEYRKENEEVLKMTKKYGNRDK